MGNNVIKYGPDVLAALIRELDEPITSAITNPAPIEHGLVMDAEHAEATLDRLMAANRQAATSKRALLPAGDYTVGDALGLRRMGEPTTFAQPIIARSMRTLAANLAVAGALCAAYLSGVNAAASWLSGQLDGQNAWEPGCGRAWGGGA